MGKLTLHIGPSTSYYFFKEKILEHLNANQPEIFIYLLPVNRAMRYLKKQLAYESPGRILIDPKVYTFSSFMLHLYKKLAQPKKLISNTMRLVLVNHILNEKKNDLEFFNTFRLPGSGLVNKIDNMLGEFCEFGYRPEDFAFAPLTAQEKYHDFARLLSSLHQIYSNQLIDEPAMIMEVVDSIDEALFRKIFPQVKYLYINGYGIYSPPMLKFINKVRDWCEIDVKLEHNLQNKVLFQHTSNAFDALSKMAHRIKTGQEQNDLLYHNLFNTIFSLTKEAKGNIQYYLQKAKNRKEEVAFIAARIKKYFHEQHMSLHELGITFPDIEIYAPLIQTLFKEHEIPYNLSTGFALIQSPLIKSYLQVLKIVINGFRTEDIYGLLVSPFIHLDPPVDARIFRQAATQIKLKNFNLDWQKSFESIYTYYKGEKGNSNTPQNQIGLDALKILTKHLLKLFNSLRRIEKNKPANFFHSEYLKILTDLGLMNWYERDTEFLSSIEREREFRALNRFIKLLNQKDWIQKYIYGEKKISLAQYYQNLVLIIQDATYSIKEWSNYGVQILPRLEIQSVNLQVLFIGGLIEGKFPRQYTRDIFFNDSERQMMGLNACEDLLDQDRFLFYQLLSSPAQQVVLSYPAFEDDATLLPSTFISNLQDVCDIELDDSDIDEKSLLSSKNIVEYIGKNLKEGLSEDDERLFQSWLIPENLDETSYWLDAVETMINKTDRSHITNFEGNLSSNREIVKILKAENLHRPFSVTSLESYAFCPMQYFLQRILHLPEEEEPEETISALERGSLLHKILFRFYTQLKKTGTHNWPWEHKKLLYEIASEEFEKMPYSGLLWTLEKENIFGSNERVGLWDSFLEIEEKEIKSTGFKPQYFEVSFGYTGRDAYHDEISTGKCLSIKSANHEVKIVGKIDRIDCDEQGRAMVFDYKTGSINPYTINKIYVGSSLQLPLYLEYVQQGLRDKGITYLATAGAYYQIKDGEACRRKIILADGELTQKLTVTGAGRLPNKKFEFNGKPISFRQMIERSLKFVLEYVEALNNGNFQHTRDPEDQRCSQYCTYSKVCRKDVAKIMAMKVG